MGSNTKPLPRIAVLTHSLRVYKTQFLDTINPQDHEKVKPVTRIDDLRGKRFLSYITLWDFGRERNAYEIEELAQQRLLVWD